MSFFLRASPTFKTSSQEVIDKLCPDRKDRGAYGSIFLGGCKNTINEQLNILVVDDATGENGGFLEDDAAYKLVGDCYGQISTELYNRLTNRVEQKDKSYRVVQHRFGWRSLLRDTLSAGIPIKTYRMKRCCVRVASAPEAQIATLMCR